MTSSYSKVNNRNSIMFASNLQFPKQNQHPSINNRFLLPANLIRFHFQHTPFIRLLSLPPFPPMSNCHSICSIIKIIIQHLHNSTDCRHHHQSSYQSNLHCLANSNTWTLVPSSRCAFIIALPSHSLSTVRLFPYLNQFVLWLLRGMSH